MGYRMHFCFGENGKIEDPTPEDIDRVIDELRPIKNNFVVLVSDPRIENCECIQTLIEQSNDSNGVFQDDEIVYLVEVQFKYSKNKRIEKGKFNQYAFHTSDVEKVKRMFRMFSLGVIPDVTGWKDITEVMNELIDKRKE